MLIFHACLALWMLEFKALLSQTHVSAGEEPEMARTVELLVHKAGE